MNKVAQVICDRSEPTGFRRMGPEFCDRVPVGKLAGNSGGLPIGSDWNITEQIGRPPEFPVKIPTGIRPQKIRQRVRQQLHVAYREDG